MGRLPILGPIIASVIIADLLNETLPKEGRKMGGALRIALKMKRELSTTMGI